MGFGRLAFGDRGAEGRVLLALAKSLLGNFNPGRFGIWRWSSTPPAGEVLLKPRDREDPRDRAWRCRRPLGRLREENVGCSTDWSVSSEGFLGPTIKTANSKQIQSKL